MPELSADNAADWLSRHDLPTADVHFTELGGGISNKVIGAAGPGVRLVLKQALGKLRTVVEWESDRSRIVREADALRWLAGKKISGNIPRLVFEEPSTFTLAMEMAPEGAEMWKPRLFRGEFDSDAARLAGTTLGDMIAASWGNSEARRLFGNQTVFEQLRLEPYYRFAAASRPEAATYIDRLIGRSSARRVSLVHGDWSPKNLLVGEGQLWVIDWEVVHYGDPSFDAAFLLNHLLMKSIAMPQHREALRALAVAFAGGLRAALPSEAGWVLPAALEHLPALLLSRVAGKSPAEYLLDFEMKSRAERVAMDLMCHPAATPEELFSR